MDHTYCDPADSEQNFVKDIGKSDTGKSETSMKRKKVTKTTRLTQSIENNQKFLKINEEKARVDQHYKETKIEIMKRDLEMKETYYQKKIDIFKSILIELRLLREAFQRENSL